MSKELLTVQALLQELRQLLPNREELHQRGPTWSEDELGAFESKHRIGLPGGYRGFLLSIGDGGSGFTSGLMVALRAMDPASLKHAHKPFPLTKGWVDPAEKKTLKEVGLLGKYKKYLYKLPKGSSPDHGSIVLGATSDHQILRLIVSGPQSGKIWTDNRGNDYEEVLPTKRTFLRLMREWAESLIADAKQRQQLEALCEKRTSTALNRAFGRERIDELFADIRGDLCRPDAEELSPNVAWVMYLHYKKARDTESAGQALVLGRHWEELLEYSEASLSQLEKGKLKRTRQIEVTHRTHIAIAEVALGRPPREQTYPDSSTEYYHYDAALIPLALSRWKLAALESLLSSLRSDVAAEFRETIDPSVA